MPVYDIQNQYQQQNVNYTNRDFNDLKRALINYTKAYYPNAYKDFNETSPGMMLLELSAYTGDVLNYYVDDSFKEMLLPLAEDRENLINLSKVTGYKPKSIVPSYVDLKFTLSVTADTTNIDNVHPTLSELITIAPGAQVQSTSNPEVFFETLEPVDFSVSSSLSDIFQVDTVDNSTGLAETFKADRIVRAVSGETKTVAHTISNPESYKRITLPDTNVIEIVSVIDSNNNPWYEVEYLAQENVPISTYYKYDANRVSAYTDVNDTNLPVPYSLSYIKTSKRFTTEVNEDSTTSLVFGNGIIREGQNFETTFLEVEQEGVTLPKTNFSPKPLNPRMGIQNSSLGESPQHTTLTIKYRIGGGFDSNVPANDLSTGTKINTLPAGGSTTNLVITNDQPAVGGKAGDMTEEIRYNSIANFSTQNRCVTKEDYEARIMNLPSRFGSIAKVYVTTGGDVTKTDNINLVQNLQTLMDQVMVGVLSSGQQGIDSTEVADLGNVNLIGAAPLLSEGGDIVSTDDRTRIYESFEALKEFTGNTNNISTVDIYVLAYDINKNLVNGTDLIKQNIKNYLSQYRLISDKIRILDGYIINFGVLFDVLAYPNYDKSVIKTRCIEAIKEYFRIESMQFKQVLYTANLINILNKVEGVKAVNDVILTQDVDFTNPSGESIFKDPPLYSKSISEDGDMITLNSAGYNYFYNFRQFFEYSAPEGRGVIVPSVDPSIFELKHPNTNIKGRVR